MTACYPLFRRHWYHNTLSHQPALPRDAVVATHHHHHQHHQPPPSTTTNNIKNNNHHHNNNHYMIYIPLSGMCLNGDAIKLFMEHRASSQRHVTVLAPDCVHMARTITVPSVRYDKVKSSPTYKYSTFEKCADGTYKSIDHHTIFKRCLSQQLNAHKPTQGDVILIPINIAQVHWCVLAFVPGDHPASTTKKYEVQLFNSMASEVRTEQIRTLWVSRLRTDILSVYGRLSDVLRDDTPLVEREVPQQRNNYDCGVYVCRFADEMQRRTPTSNRMMSLRPADVEGWRDFVHETVKSDLIPAVLRGSMSFL